MNAATPRRPAILLLGDTLKVGGTERQFVRVACGIDAARWDVHVACLRAEGPLRDELEKADVRVSSCGHGSLKPPRSLATVWNVARYVRRHRIVLVHSFDFYSNMIAIPAARLAGVPVIASQRNLGNLRPKLQQRLHHAVLRGATHVMVNSRAIVERLGGVTPDKIVVIPNGVDAPRLGPAARSSLAVFGTVANLHPYKGLADLVRATAIVHARYPDVRLAIWGEGRLRPELEQLIAERGLRGIVELRGFAADVEAALRGLDAFVLPSLSEGCSNSLLEAMASGLPVIASDVGGNPEIVEDGLSGLLVPSRDAVALAKAMMRLIEDPALAGRLATQGAERVRSEFSIEQMLERMQRAYRRTLAHGVA